MKTPKLKAVTVADLESLVRALGPMVRESVREEVREQLKPLMLQMGEILEANRQEPQA
jgi:hypothetical protein